MTSDVHPTWTPPERLTATEHRGRIEDGLSRPLAVACVGDGGLRAHVVLKVRTPAVGLGQNHHGPTSLACELACAVLARALGLDVPDYFVVDVPEGLAASVQDAEARALLEANVGPNFGTRFIDGTEPWDEDSRFIGQPLLECLEGVLNFDASVFNPDRCIGNPNLIWNGQTPLYLIDHSLAAPAHRWPPETIDQQSRFTGRETGNHCCRRALLKRGLPFERVSRMWRELVTPDTMSQVQQMIPAAWETQPGDIARVISFLGNRAGRLDQVVRDLREMLG